MDYILYQVDVFTEKPFEGNPAGIVPDAKGLTEETMQKIATEINVSETAFVTPINKKEYQVRFFTPECEIDLCGHATIATFFTLAHKGYIDSIKDGALRVYQITKVGRLPVDIYFKNGQVDKVMMHQDKPKSLGTVNNLKEISEALSIKLEDIGIGNREFKSEIISTGLPDIILPVKSKAILDNLKIDFPKLKQISKQYNVIGLHVFCIENEKKVEKVYCRNFAPIVGINEESATGTSNGALIYYLKKNNILKKDTLIAYQGEHLGRPSEIFCEIEQTENDYIVKVGGRSHLVLESVILI
ncbi:PhzF family phenazine biosynthesis protein [Caldisalinibacter kiritimatiensis]|uniref:Putative isomerase yddE, PhzC-PhzF family n=1 Tax=Caldisalinibacter kiritimatiensis TaxID=1304284 RepID=R1ARZ3_9FIRM|nr:PhzF family phenazine biosynthesis protein [Caldisalinibacter kiritimatiensis]EOC99421.1 Putative isomerase yddE, PhzC-PhzF family [Caldisalinibacter kiritimatiensis]